MYLRDTNFLMRVKITVLSLSVLVTAPRLWYNKREISLRETFLWE